MDRWKMDGSMDGRMFGWVDGKNRNVMVIICVCVHDCVCVCVLSI